MNKVCDEKALALVFRLFRSSFSCRCNSNASSSLQNHGEGGVGGSCVVEAEAAGVAGAPAAAQAAVVIIEQQTPLPQLVSDSVPPLPRSSQQDDQVAECQVESVNRDNNSIIHNSKPQQGSSSSSGKDGSNAVASTDCGEAVLAGDKEEKQQPLLSSANGNANEPASSGLRSGFHSTKPAPLSPALMAGSSVPVLRKLGEKTPPGTLKKVSHTEPVNSCKSWCEQYGQTFLAKTIDMPLPDPGPYAEDDENSN